jgi:hypothetical protein
MKSLIDLPFAARKKALDDHVLFHELHRLRFAVRHAGNAQSRWDHRLVAELVQNRNLLPVRRLSF